MRSWKLGRAFGINIFVHWTFLLLVAFVLVNNWQLGGSALAVHSVILLLAAFGCVVLHELGHALAARHFGIPTLDITLYPIGGIARLARMSEKPFEEFCIAVAGPAVNALLAALLIIPVCLSWQASTTIEQAPKGNLLFGLLLINVILLLFNMLPAFPMDGGRVLRALLVIPVGRLKATQLAANLGAVFAVLFVVWGIASFNPMPLLVGFFAFIAGRQELAYVRYQESVRRAPPLDVLPADAEILDALPVGPGENFSGSVWDERTRMCVIWRNGRPVYSYRMD
jgi:Zn-dependent protease